MSRVTCAEQSVPSLSGTDPAPATMPASTHRSEPQRSRPLGKGVKRRIALPASPPRSSTPSFLGDERHASAKPGSTAGAAGPLGRYSSPGAAPALPACPPSLAARRGFWPGMATIPGDSKDEGGRAAPGAAAEALGAAPGTVSPIPGIVAATQGTATFLGSHRPCIPRLHARHGWCLWKTQQDVATVRSDPINELRTLMWPQVVSRAGQPPGSGEFPVVI